MKKVRKAIIPAAGLGTRFLPATKAMPKEMLPIVDKPTIQYIVEEAIESGIEDIIIAKGNGPSKIISIMHSNLKRILWKRINSSYWKRYKPHQKWRFTLSGRKSLKAWDMLSGVHGNSSARNRLPSCLAMILYRQKHRA